MMSGRITTRSLLALLLTSIVLITASCKSDSRVPQEQSMPSPFRGAAFRSLDELATAALNALQSGRPEALHALRVDREEYRDVIWSRIPQDELANIDVETAWGWVERDSWKAVGRVITDFGGEKYTLKKTIISKETRVFPQIRVIYGLLVVAVDTQGNEGTIKLMNVVAEIDGYYRVIAFDS